VGDRRPAARHGAHQPVAAPGNTIPDAVVSSASNCFNTTLSVNGTNFITNSLLFAFTSTHFIRVLTLSVNKISLLFFIVNSDTQFLYFF
jgi:hypothetical protein